MMSHSAAFFVGSCFGAWICYRPDRPVREKPTDPTDVLIWKAERWLAIYYPASATYDLIEDMYFKLKEMEAQDPCNPREF